MPGGRLLGNRGTGGGGAGQGVGRVIWGCGSTIIMVGSAREVYRRLQGVSESLPEGFPSKIASLVETAVELA